MSVFNSGEFIDKYDYSIIVVGYKCHKLTVVGLPFKKYKSKYAKCICECGKEVDVTLNRLFNLTQKSCGCIRIGSKTQVKHGLVHHPLYKVFNTIKCRCENEKDHNFINYGGRGISIEKEWRDDFKCFYEWCIKNGYKKGLQIDRIDNNGNYCPQNCRFVVHKINSRNQRRTIFIEGVPVGEFVDKLFPNHTKKELDRFRGRVLKRKWSIKEAVDEFYQKSTKRKIDRKFSDEDIREIRKLSDTGHSKKYIFTKFNTGRAYLWAILTGKVYTHVK